MLSSFWNPTDQLTNPKMDTQTDTPAPATEAEAPATLTAAGPYAGLVNPDGTYAKDWTRKLPQEMQGYAATAGRFTSLPATIRAYANAQRELNKFQQSAVMVPGEDADERTITTYRDKVGAPAEAEGYGLHQAPEGVSTWDSGFGQEVNAVLHKYHVPAAAAQELAQLEQQRIAAYEGQRQASEEDYDLQAESYLRAEWGDDYARNRQEAEHVARSFGLDPNRPNLSHVLQAFQQLAGYIREDETLQRQTGISAESLNSLGIEGGTSQAMDIVRNPNNAWHDAYHGKQGAQRQHEARQHFHALARNGA